MIDIKKLLESERVEMTFMDSKVDKEFVKSFRNEFNLTQVALATILGVKKKTIEKWEQGVNKINGSSAILMKLLKDNPELIAQVYSVKHGVKGQLEEEYQWLEDMTVATSFETTSCVHPNYRLRPAFCLEG